MSYTSDDLKRELRGLFATLMERVATETGEWTVKGFIDIYRRIYTITTDTKVLSKILELMLFPILHEFAVERGFTVDLAAYQNHYPDLTLTTAENMRFAVDIKTTYRIAIPSPKLDDKRAFEVKEEHHLTHLPREAHDRYSSTFGMSRSICHDDHHAADGSYHHSYTEHDRASDDVEHLTVDRQRWQLPHSTAMVPYGDSVGAGLLVVLSTASVQSSRQLFAGW